MAALCTHLGAFLLLDDLTKHSGYAQIHFTAVGRMNADTKITEQIPVLQGPVQIPSQSGEVTDQQNVNVPIHRLIMKFQQAGAVIEFQPACYIAGSPNDFKAMLLCVSCLLRHSTSNKRWRRSDRLMLSPPFRCSLPPIVIGKVFSPRTHKEISSRLFHKKPCLVITFPPKI